MQKIIAALKLKPTSSKRRPDAFEQRLHKISVQSRRPAGRRVTA
jgi:hypothetical protein